ncbi:MAG: hypothetical protein WC489_00670 [Patescibacteria group bacterium]
MKYHYEDENIKIIIYFPNKKTALLANASVSIRTTTFGFYTTKGFQIWTSSLFNERLSEQINITPPKLKYFGYKEITYVEDKKDWIELERLIYSAYQFARSEKERKQNMNTEIINPSDVPI